MFDHPTRSKHLYASGGFHFWFDDVGMNQRIAAPTKKIAATMCPSPVLGIARRPKPASNAGHSKNYRALIHLKAVDHLLPHSQSRFQFTF
jgi:hypothetical protein